MLILIIIILLLIVAVRLFMQQPQFGKIAFGNSLAAITNSSNFRNGQFQNLSHTPNLKEGASYFTVMKDFFFSKSKRSRPAHSYLL